MTIPASGEPAGEEMRMVKDEILAGLKAGRRLRCDRKDEPLLPWLLSHPDIENRFAQIDSQSSVIEFWWKDENDSPAKV